MRALIQKVKEASVVIKGKTTASIGRGLLVFIGIGLEDSETDIEWLSKKIIQLRIFEDEKNIMNLSVSDVQGDILAVSQFTLMATTKKGNRPSYIRAASPSMSEPLYEQFLKIMRSDFSGLVQSGTFGADMKVHLINNGPVTIFIDTKNKE